MSQSRAQSNADTVWTSALDRATPERPVHVGRYTVVGLIASGGMGKVYEAIHRDHNARVALKTLVRVDVDRVMRFKNEFRYVADLCHPNLVPLYELSCHEGLWFITMERVDGVTFLDWVRPQPVAEPPLLTQSHARSRTALDRNAATFVDSDETIALEPTTTFADAPEPRERPATAPPSLQRLREAFVQLVRAVSALHAAGLLHLDLKPSNVLVDHSGRVVVLDFGLARLLEPRRRPESDDDEPVTISGTPTWMPPEQFELAALDESSDWYAVGLMLYVALTGVFPFPTTSVAAIWFAKKSARPVRPETLVPELPHELCALATALIKPEREDRPPGRLVLEQLSGEQSTERATSARREFIGRAHERALLREALASARNGDAVIAHVSGTSGLGKSALLRAFVDEARAQHETLVLRGRCYERETVPFKALDGIVDELAQHLERMPQEELAQRLPARIADLARVFPSLMRVTAVARRVLASAGASSTHSVVELRRRASEALRRLLHLLCARGPVALLIDDLQWADGDSAAMLVGLIDAPAPPRMLLACSYRPDEAAANRALGPYFEQARARAAAHEIKTLAVAIAPLSLDESEALAAATLSRLGISSQSLIDRVANESGGVPFFVEELAHYAAQRWLDRDADSTALSLETVLSQRVQSLDPSERALVEVLAVANSPIPLDAWFAVAQPATSSLRALWSLRGQHFVHSTGAQASDTVELHHDRMRESVYRGLDRARIAAVHLGLARAFAARGASSPWLFDAVRHASAVLDLLGPDERRAIAELALAAGRAARQSAAFRLAFDSFRQGLEMLGERPFERAYELALALHSGAADAAYLCAEWSAVEQHASAVYAHSERAVDRLQAWEAHIDSCCARKRYNEAVDVALGALALLDVRLPAHPTADEVGAYVGRAIERVSALSTNGVLELEPMKDARTAAAMRIQTRIGSATYFARPALFPLLACNGVALSTEHGIATATPYALAVFAVVLNSMGRFREAHAWGQAALAMLDRNEDRALDARTRHVVHDLVCVFTVPLESSLDDLRAVVELGEEIGDPEYAAYAAHAYVHNALWASRPLGALLDEARRFHRFMLAYEQFNALHVHLPFEQLIRCLMGQTDRPGSLDSDGFDERSALAAAVDAGSRSAQFLLQMLMGIARYHFATGAEASALLEAARPFIDGVASTWHVPMFHQYAALAIYAIDDEAQRGARIARALESEAALAPFAQAGPENFAHRVTLLRAERARVERRTREAVALYEQSANEAERSRFYADVGIAHSLAARALREDDEAAHGAAIAAHAALARRAFSEWNAFALLR